MRERDIARFWSHVEKGDSCWLWTASVRANGYGQVNIEGINRTAHRVAYELTHGAISAGMLVDHMCRVRACVNPAHLREVTKKQNAENRAELTDSSSGVRNVTWDRQRRKWAVSITHFGKTISFGRYDDLSEATSVARAARTSIFSSSDPQGVSA